MTLGLRAVVEAGARGASEETRKGFGSVVVRGLFAGALFGVGFVAVGGGFGGEVGVVLGFEGAGFGGGGREVESISPSVRTGCGRGERGGLLDGRSVPFGGFFVAHLCGVRGGGEGGDGVSVGELGVRRKIKVRCDVEKERASAS